MKLQEYFGFLIPSDFIDGQWKSPLNLSIGFHILILVTAMIAPSLFARRPHLPEFYTVNLINVTEIPRQTVPQTSKVAPAKTKKEVTPRSLEKQAQSISPTLPAEAISLKPVKRKIKRAKDTNLLNIEKMKMARELERLRAEQELKRSKEKASLAAKDALNKLRQSLQASTAQSTPTEKEQIGESIGGPIGTGIEMEEVLKRFYAAVFQHIWEHWVLPPFQNWDDSLEAVLVITVRKDGAITKSFFEKKSENMYFNQFVMKIIREAAPLPPLPMELKESAIEIGLRFTPAGVF